MVEFTKREREVIVRIAEGKSTKQTSHELGLGTDRVNALVVQVRRKLGAANRSEAASKWAAREASRRAEGEGP